jgi:putative flippase GtrA
MKQQEHKGRITIGVPTRNRAEYVMRALHSALAQTHRNIEIIVSDNASTDDTVTRIEAIPDPRLILLKQPVNIGMVGNFNACLQRATGSLFLMLSDDDVLDPSAIERLSRPFFDGAGGSSSESIGMVWSPCAILSDKGEALWTTQAGPEIEDSVSMIEALFNGLRGPRFCSVLVRTADAITAGAYSEERYGAICDTGNWARVAVRYRHAVCISEPQASYTLHAASETGKYACSDWQKWGETMCADLAADLRSVGNTEGESRIRLAGRHLTANLIATILIQAVSKPGGISLLCREVARSWNYLITPYTIRRVFRDGWKLLQLRLEGTAWAQRLTQHIPPGQFGRYLLVGCWNTAFGYATFAALTALLDPRVAHGYILASILSSPLNITVAFLAYKRFVFKTKGNYLREWSRCVTVYGSGILIGAALLPIVVAAVRLGFGLGRSAPYAAAALLTMFGVVYTFFGHKRFSFKTRPAIDGECRNST